MLDEGLGLELGEDVDRAHARVDEVREDEVDDAVLATERSGRLGPVARQGIEAVPLSASQHHAEHVHRSLHRLTPSLRNIRALRGPGYGQKCQRSAWRAWLFRTSEV